MSSIAIKISPCAVFTTKESRLADLIALSLSTSLNLFCSPSSV